MKFKDFYYKVHFQYAKDLIDIDLRTLGNTTINFLEHFGHQGIVGKKFYAIIQEGDGEKRFRRLLHSTGYKENPQGFFTEFLQQLEQSNCQSIKGIEVGRIEIPYYLIIHILQVLIPGNKFITIKNVQQLETLTKIKIPDEDRNHFQQVIETYPVRLSLHVVRQMMVSQAIAYQYLPFTEELNRSGMVHTWVGQFHRGIIEQMYQNRVIFVLNMSCPVYCRFCFRKHKECRNQKAPIKDHVKDAVTYIRENPDVKEIVLTGGDPFMNKATLTAAIEGLKMIPHVQSLRIATRCISYYPYMFFQNDFFWINYLKSKHLELQQKGKRIEIATHFIHPDEISLDSLDIISELTRVGIAVYVQTPFLNNCNDEGPELVRLYNQLRGAGAEIHYIYIPCSTIQGNEIYKTPISKGLEVGQYLRAHLSDRAVPSICTATAIGKIDWNSSGWAVEVDENDEKFLWLRTPYTLDYYQKFAPILNISHVSRVNSEGTLDARFLADIGDENLLTKEREYKPAESEFLPKSEAMKETVAKSLEHIQQKLLKDQRERQTIVNTGSSSLFRIHKTRVELDCCIEQEDIDYNLDYIKKHDSITDVIIASPKDAIESLYRVIKIIEELYKLPNINAIRIRSLKLNYTPELYSNTIINKLAGINKLTIVNPKRLEIETCFLHSNEFSERHTRLVNFLRQRGITVYNNTPLLSLINDSPQEILDIAYQCRKRGIEFQNIYIAGLPIQRSWNKKQPIDISEIIDIATRLRRHGSGREIPRYVIRTELGEVDYTLPTQICEPTRKGRVRIKLLPYTLEYFRQMDPDFILPERVKVDKQGKLSIPINELEYWPH